MIFFLFLQYKFLLGNKDGEKWFFIKDSSSDVLQLSVAEKSHREIDFFMKILSSPLPDAVDFSALAFLIRHLL